MTFFPPKLMIAVAGATIIALSVAFSASVFPAVL